MSTSTRDEAPTPSVRRRGPFLTARWERLALLNYECPQELLAPLVPRGTELDPWKGSFLVSMVGFMFCDTRVRGVAIPFHRTFEEVNLRFYVRRKVGSELRRGVVFVRELVPRFAIAAVARAVYNEPYSTVSMTHSTTLDEEAGGSAEYAWHYKRAPFELGARVVGAAQPLAPGSEAEFITEHYWGYTRQKDGSTREYEVEHRPWRVWESQDAWLTGPCASLYGAAFGEVLRAPPSSAFVALGSEVAVYPGAPL